ncbi:hypothetical protein [Spirillospora sp. CA-128828]|uniref:hypothetical protein n=1 Tax=Spirillospora sp. CA-128828 TaxID=3240033 RepID=UPI003D8A4A73
MRQENGLLGRRQPRPEWETGPVPYPIRTQKATLDEPTDTMVEHLVQGIYADLPPEVRADVIRVARELIRNAQWHGKRSAEAELLRSSQPAQLRSSQPDFTLILGWATDEEEQVVYPLVVVSDRSAVMPQVLQSTRTGLKRVISLTHRCGAESLTGQKRVWALVDPQRQ